MAWLLELLDWDGLSGMVPACGALLAIGAIAHLNWAIRRLRARLRKRDRSLARSLSLVAMAERLAGFGRWRVYPDGTDEWSAGMLALTGFPPGFLPDPETRRALLPDGGKAFYGAFKRNIHAREPYRFEIEADRVDGARRLLRVIAQNEFDGQGVLVQRYGIAIDITDEHRRFEDLARQKGEAVAKAKAATRLAETDPLTGLANRRRVMADADRAALASARDGIPLAVVIFNIDHFKVVNDCHGHPAGDAVLVKVAEIARQTVRSRDVVGRIGGEEFLCVLPGADLATARRCAERLRRAIGESTGGEGVPAVTISVGFAGWRKGDSALALFARADAALYEAKQAGRDCVRIAA